MQADRPEPLHPTDPPVTTLYLDVTHSFVTGLATGIQRVVRKVTAELLRGPVAGFERVRPVVALDGRFLLLDAAGVERLLHPPATTGHAPSRGPAVRLGARLGTRLPGLMDRLQRGRFARTAAAAINRPLEQAAIGAGDLVLLIDAFWGGSATLAAAQAARRQGAAVVAVAHDLIPATHPHHMTPVAATLFVRRLREAMETCNGFVAVSRATAAELHRFAAPRRLRTAIAYSGADFAAPDAVAACAIGPAATRNPPPPPPPFSYITVGTLEPRKGHGVILDAFERLWAGGSGSRLTFVGRRGWGVDALWERCRAIAAGDLPFRLVDDADDDAMARLLAESSAAIVASEVEGFGLPVVEALSRGLPVIAADIPVFREITGTAARFFAVADPAALADAVLAFERDPEPLRAAARHFRWPTWREAAHGYAATARRLRDEARADADADG